MANSIAFAKNYTGILDEVYQRAADAAQLIIDGRIGDAQARYNKKHEGL